VAQWLRNAELVFAASAMPAGDQVRTISTRLKGPALTWFIERLDRRGGIPFVSWEEFSAGGLSLFGFIGNPTGGGERAAGA
jgi:hypothetical protein